MVEIHRPSTYNLSTNNWPLESELRRHLRLFRPACRLSTPSSEPFGLARERSHVGCNICWRLGCDAWLDFQRKTARGTECDAERTTAGASWPVASAIER